MASTISARFSNDLAKLAHSSPDGIIRIWDSDTSKLQSEYSPSSHLSSTCSCLCWSPNAVWVSPKKKRRKSNQGNELDASDLVIVGTSSGNLLLYSVSMASLYTQMSEKHDDAITGAAVCASRNSLFTCSLDQHIIEWDPKSTKISNKWKADNSPIYSIAISPAEEYLISASRKITVWSIDKLEKLQIFNGHASEVYYLSFVHWNCSNGESIIPYFVTSAVHDRIVNVWQVNPSARDNKNALVSFSLPEDAKDVFLSKPDQKSKVLLMGVLSRTGKLFLFEHILNGPCAKPLRPKVTVQVVSPSRNGVSSSKPIPIVSAGFVNDDNNHISLAYGSSLKLGFERFKYDSSQSEVELVRQDPSACEIVKEDDVTVVRMPSTKNAQLYGPGQQISTSSSYFPKEREQPAKLKRKAPSDEIKEMSLEERVRLSEEKSPLSQAKSGHGLKADNLVVLLEQGLRSGDSRLLNQVLTTADVRVVTNTIRDLPLKCIVPLVTLLTEKMQQHAVGASVCAAWLLALLCHRTSYLMTFPDVISQLTVLQERIQHRTSMFGRVVQLHGKLHLLLQQGKSVQRSLTLQSEPVVSFQALSSRQKSVSNEDEDMASLSEQESFADDDGERVDSEVEDADEEEAMDSNEDEDGDDLKAAVGDVDNDDDDEESDEDGGNVTAAKQQAKARVLASSSSGSEEDSD